jgi:hypothetical protein
LAALFVALLAIAFASYLGALLVLRSRGGNLVLACLLAAAIQLTPLAGPLLLSRDAYSYWAYGRIVASHHQNPFTLAPAREPRLGKGWLSALERWAAGSPSATSSLPVLPTAQNTRCRNRLRIKMTGCFPPAASSMSVGLVRCSATKAGPFRQSGSVGLGPSVVASKVIGATNPGTRSVSPNASIERTAHVRP